MDGVRYGRAFVKSVVHKFSTEVGAAVTVGRSLTAITYPDELYHPWPRGFGYHTELFAPGDDPAAEVAETISIVGRSEHVLTVFCSAESTGGFIQQGYQHAWTNVILRAPIPDEDLSLPTDVTIVGSVADVSEANSIEPDNLCSPFAIDDPFLTDLVARHDGRVVAKAQVVTLPGEPACVSDMFTADKARERGHGSALLLGALGVAAGAGATEAILVPSLSTRESGFYTKRGFADVLPMSRLIPVR